MSEVPGADGAREVDLYDSTYRNFHHEIYESIRRAIWGEDIGQNSWTTAAEHDEFIGLLKASAGRRVLEVGCGSGGPTLRLAGLTGCHAVGIDHNAEGIAAAGRRAAEQGLTDRVTFRLGDANAGLAFDDASFDGVICVDAINHLADRGGVLREWARVLLPGGRLLYSDPVVVTGVVSSAELAVRSSIGPFVFSASGVNERLLEAVGLRVVSVLDRTAAAAAETAQRWHDVRSERSEAVRAVEGDATFEGQQAFLRTTALLARERRLSRFVFVAEKPGAASNAGC